MTGYDDFLNLKTAQFPSFRLTVFTGVSGSGKYGYHTHLPENPTETQFSQCLSNFACAGEGIAVDLRR